MTRKILNGLDLANQRIVALGDPSAATDAVNLQTLQLYVNGLDNKASVRVATTAAGTLATSFENGDTVDGVVLATGDRILVKNQASGSENGIRIVQASGAPTRATDADISAEVTAGLVVFVSEGTVNGNTNWQLTTDDPIVLDTTALTFTQIAAGTTYTAGDGLTESPAATFNVNPGSGLEISSDTVRIAASAAGSGLTGGAGSALAVGAGNGITVNADDVALASSTAGAGLTYTTGVLAVGAGDGVSVAADAVAVDSTVARTFSTGTHSSGTSITWTHSLGKQFVCAHFFITSTGEEIFPDVTMTSTTVTTTTFAASQTANTITCRIVA